MTTTELIKILQDNETGAISLKPREISLTINGRYMPNPQITLSSTGDGICGAEIDLDVCGEWLEQEPKTGHWVSDVIQGEIDGQIIKAFTCSECGAISVFRITGGIIVNGDLCPNCGAKMIEPQESEG